MNFEHLIQINDPLNPFVETMTREQVWEGLVLRAEQPQLFVIGLDRCAILSRDGDVLERELHYGQASVRDRVTLHRRSQRALRHPADGRLRRRLADHDDRATGRAAACSCASLTPPPCPSPTIPTRAADVLQTQEIVKSAYREADIDTVRIIRQFAHGRKHEGPLH